MSINESEKIVSITSEFDKWAEDVGFSSGEDNKNVKEMSKILQTGQFKNTMRLIMRHFLPNDEVVKRQRHALAVEYRASSIPREIAVQLGPCRNIEEFADQIEATRLKLILSSLWFKFEEFEMKIDRTLQKYSSMRQKVQNKRAEDAVNFKKCQSLVSFLSSLKLSMSTLDFLNETVEIVSDENRVLNRIQELSEWKIKVRDNANSLERSNEVAHLTSKIKDDLGLELPDTEPPGVSRRRIISSMNQVVIDAFAQLNAMEKTLKEKEDQLKKMGDLGALKTSAAKSEGKFIARYVDEACSTPTDPENEKLKEVLQRNKRKINDLCDNINFGLNFSIESLEERLNQTRCEIQCLTEESASRKVKSLVRQIPGSLEEEIELRLRLASKNPLQKWNLQNETEGKQVTSGGRFDGNPDKTDPEKLVNSRVSLVKSQGEEIVTDFHRIHEHIGTRLDELSKSYDSIVRLLDYWKRGLMSNCLSHDEDYNRLRKRFVDSIDTIVELEADMDGLSED